MRITFQTAFISSSRIWGYPNSNILAREFSKFNWNVTGGDSSIQFKDFRQFIYSQKNAIIILKFFGYYIYNRVRNSQHTFLVDRFWSITKKYKLAGIIDLS